MRTHLVAPVVLLALGVAAGLIGCRATTGGSWAGLPPPGSATFLGEEQELRVRRLYLSKCAKCHQLYNPHRYSAAEWGEWMRKMTKRSKLNAEQTESLTRYLEFVRSVTPPQSE